MEAGKCAHSVEVNRHAAADGIRLMNFRWFNFSVSKFGIAEDMGAEQCRKVPRSKDRTTHRTCYLFVDAGRKIPRQIVVELFHLVRIEIAEPF